MHLALAAGLALLAAPSTTAAAVPNWRQIPLNTISILPPPPTLDAPPQLVNVTLYAMSRCPDARMCESVFEQVLKHEGLKSKIDMRVNFLGEVDPKASYGATCMHGDIECAGNAHQLCLEKHLDLDKFYATLSCMNFGTFPGAIGTVALTRKCAETNSVNWWQSGVGRCIQGQRAEREGRAAQRQIKQDNKGAEFYPSTFDVEDDDAPLEYLGHEARNLLRRSIYATQKAEVKKSCTIDISSTTSHERVRRCIVDGGVWKGCDDGHTPADFVRVIEKEWKSLNDLTIEDTTPEAVKEADKEAGKEAGKEADKEEADKEDDTER